MANGLNRFCNDKWRKGGKRHLLSRAKMHRQKHVMWTYDGDGRFAFDRIDRPEKRRIRRWYLKQLLDQAMKDYVDALE